MKTTVDGHEINYELAGPSSAPVVMLSHSLATNLSMWDPQIDALASDYRVLRYDTRGHGGSDAPLGPYSLDRLARDARSLMAALHIDRIHWIGISLGGMIGQTLALDFPECLASLALCDTTSRIPPESKPLWDERVRIAETEGMEPLVEPTVSRWFTPEFRKSRPLAVDSVRAMIRGTPTSGYVGCCHAVATLDLTERIKALELPVLVLVGEEDQSTPVAMARTLHERIAGSEWVLIPSASHLSNIEQSEQFNRAIRAFLDRLR